MVKTSTGELTFHMNNYCQMTSDNKKQNSMDIHLTVTQQCWERLHKLRLENSVFNNNGNDNTFTRYFQSKALDYCYFPWLISHLSI